MEKGVSIRIGTSGWMYRHWQKIFYPDKWPKSKWLEYYAGRFDTVELNASFYRLPNPATFKGWKERSPDNFLWSVKGSKFITHTRRLKDPAEPLSRLYNSITGLGEKLGVILFQLPPSLSFDEKLFRDFCVLLNPNFRYALEIRHPSWINSQVSAILSEFNMALCISDTGGRYPSPEAITTDFVYIRLHGPGRLYASEYSEDELQVWAEKITVWNRDIFIYFDNDSEGYAIKNAQRLKEILKEHPY